MKKYIFILLTILGISACSKEDLPVNKDTGPNMVLQLIPTLYENDTRGIADEPMETYFGLTDNKLSVTLNQTTGNYIYRSENRDLVPETDNDKLLFSNTPQGDNIEVMWPPESVRNSQQNIVPTDQSRKQDFLFADWLTARMFNVQPTRMLRVTLKHERSKVIFVTDEIHQGAKITGLTIGDYQAWCDPATGMAQLILDPTQNSHTLSNNPRGMARIGGVNHIFTLTSIPTLIAGGEHVITIK